MVDPGSGQIQDIPIEIKELYVASLELFLRISFACLTYIFTLRGASAFDKALDMRSQNNFSFFLSFGGGG